jgi:SAM-dependent methyltransferase
VQGHRPRARLHGAGPAILTAWLACAPAAAQEPALLRAPDVIYVPTPPEVVEAMLRLGGVTAADVVYDLGSGDGRIPIAAAQAFGATGVGVELDPGLIAEAKANAARAGVSDKVTFLNQDLFETDLGPATVITLYLLREMNLKLMPTLKQLRPGTRIVAHSFGMGTEWPPDRIEQVSGKSIFLFVVR